MKPPDKEVHLVPYTITSKIDLDIEISEEDYDDMMDALRYAFYNTWSPGFNFAKNKGSRESIQNFFEHYNIKFHCFESTNNQEVLFVVLDKDVEFVTEYIPDLIPFGIKTTVMGITEFKEKFGPKLLPSNKLEGSKND